MGSLQMLLHNAVNMFFRLLEFLIFVRILLSWIPMSRDNQISRMLYAVTEPILGPARNLMDRSPLGGGMMIDFSPIIALFVLRLISSLIHGLISMM